MLTRISGIRNETLSPHILWLVKRISIDAWITALYRTIIIIIYLFCYWWSSMYSFFCQFYFWKAFLLKMILMLNRNVEFYLIHEFYFYIYLNLLIKCTLDRTYISWIDKSHSSKTFRNCNEINFVDAQKNNTLMLNKEQTT